MNIQKPNHIISLATSAVLVDVDLSVWTATSQDKVISEEVTASKHADKEAGRFVKHLLAKDPDHKATQTYRQTIYNWLQRRTFDWSGSLRLLPAVDLPKFMQEYQHHETEFNRLVDAFVLKYPSIVSNMAFVQGDMFNRNEYPDVSGVRSKFRISLRTCEVPVGDFRVRVADDLAEDLSNHFNRQMNEQIQRIEDEKRERFVDVMKSIRHCCELETTVSPSGETKVKRRKLYDSTIEKALEYCETFAGFDVTGDSVFESARSSLQTLLRDINVEVLKESNSMREHVKNEVSDILSKFGI
jgi:hypothetical protein